MKKTLFPTDIWIDDWSDMETVILEMSRQLTKVNLDPMALTSSESQVFLKRVLSSSRDYARSVGYTDGYIVFNRAWARIITEPSHFIPNHCHPGAWMVGTFYVTEGGGDICFMDPRGSQDFYRDTVTDYRGEVHGNCTDFYYTPQKMHAVLFPGYLRHMVMPINIDTDQKRFRLALSWNLEYEKVAKDGWDESLVIKI